MLAATDVAARGLDVDDVDVVIQMGCRHIDSFVHRAGRTGRVGKKGLNLLFISEDEVPFMKKIEHKLKIDFELVSMIQNTPQKSIVGKLNEDMTKQADKKLPLEAEKILHEILGYEEEKQYKALQMLVKNYYHQHK